MAPSVRSPSRTRWPRARYSRNLLFRSGAQMEDLFDRVLDRTRSRLDIPALRTLFGLKNRPHHNRAAGPPAQDVVIENSQYGLTWFRVRFGLLQLKACTKGEHVLRFEATVHNTKSCAAAAALITVARSSPAWPAWPGGSTPPSTAPTSASSPTPPLTSCPCRPGSAPPVQFPAYADDLCRRFSAPVVPGAGCRINL